MKENTMKFSGLRHGENLLLPVDKVSGEASSYRLFIVGHSETGHHHVLESKTEFDVITDTGKGELYLRLFELAKLVHKKSHDKHDTLTVQPGTYLVRRKTEYDPWAEVLREVWD